ncbi:heavy-metal-associated domain-containing protein [Clostridium sp. CX1]|uniref:Heavy metal-associated domain-containing protein n=1 Tax=Clostridium tanneri TaxID=3037988 RepID=A0ABU4JRY3_9CLOT|nr:MULTISPECIES: heavy metal-associated domain-containing protein [unclassified Clostridium]MCT8978053.1 heavy-metal-associated domain-containing protein [Clostridium sp. CX1]MDW8800905.1 heavy metal-associated domain-containing protein [Clostridium sp. A1-XYC3]
MKTVHYNVSGLAGSQSKTKVKNALDKIEGIQMVAVDLSRGSIEIDYNEPANQMEIERCIKNTGYDIIT